VHGDGKYGFKVQKSLLSNKFIILFKTFKIIIIFKRMY
jgi:hypothetical protein